VVLEENLKLVFPLMNFTPARDPLSRPLPMRP